MNTLATYNVGRIVLHTICMMRDSKIRWHWNGIVRELKREFNPHKSLFQQAVDRYTVRALIVLAVLAMQF